MITIYGTDWCEDTRRSRRHLRRLSVPHEYINIDDDLDALHRALALNGGKRRTPIIDLGLDGPPLVEPDNDTLTGAIVEIDMLTQEDVSKRMAVQNVGDVERAARTVAGVALMAGASFAPRPARKPIGLLGAVVTLTGVAGWCPVYHSAGMTSLDGPGDRPDEAARTHWLSRRQPVHSSSTTIEEPVR